MTFEVDGEPVDFSETWTYKGVAYSDVPNLVVDVRLHQRLVDAARRPDRAVRVPAAQPHARNRHRPVHAAAAAESDRDMPRRPWIDEFTPGYMQRDDADAAQARATARRGSTRSATRPTARRLLKDPLDDGVMQFTRTRTLSGRERDVRLIGGGSALLRWQVTVDDVLAYAADFERSYVAVVHGRIKLRVGQIVYVAFSRDETTMGFALPEGGATGTGRLRPRALLAARSSRTCGSTGWSTRLDRLELDEMHEFVLDAWGMVVPKFLFRERLRRIGLTSAPQTCRKTDALPRCSRTTRE